MGGTLIIEDDHRINRRKSEIVSNQWKYNTVITTEVIKILELVNTAVKT